MSDMDGRSTKTLELLEPPNRRKSKINAFKNNQIRSQVFNKKDGSELGRAPSIKSSLQMKSNN